MVKRIPHTGGTQASGEVLGKILSRTWKSKIIQLKLVLRLTDRQPAPVDFGFRPMHALEVCHNWPLGELNSALRAWDYSLESHLIQISHPCALQRLGLLRHPNLSALGWHSIVRELAMLDASPYRQKIPTRTFIKCCNHSAYRDPTMPSSAYKTCRHHLTIPTNPSLSTIWYYTVFASKDLTASGILGHPSMYTLLVPVFILLSITSHWWLELCQHLDVMMLI